MKGKNNMNITKPLAVGARAIAMLAPAQAGFTVCTATETVRLFTRPSGSEINRLLNVEKGDDPPSATKTGCSSSITPPTTINSAVGCSRTS
jgi:hypothetical protein